LKRPALTNRLLVATAIGIVGGIVAAIRFIRAPLHSSDFGNAWFGAAALRHGADPYGLLGPGLQFEWPWRLYYPVTSMVVALPLSFLDELTATFLFVAISSALLAFALTADGWYRLPLFLSWPFVIAAAAGQWSPILTAAVLLPSLGWILIAKPNLGAAIFASTSSERLQKTAAIGGALILAFSLVWFPGWPREWLTVIEQQRHMSAPIVRPGGVFVLLALLKWRRPEARLIVALACVPQTNSWYEALPLLLVPSNLRESLILSFLSTLGFFLPPYVMTARNELEFNAQMGSLMVAICYLPATLMVLRRPNEGEFPAWVTRVASRIRRPRASAA